MGPWPYARTPNLECEYGIGHRCRGAIVGDWVGLGGCESENAKRTRYVSHHPLKTRVGDSPLPFLPLPFWPYNV